MLLQCAEKNDWALLMLFGRNLINSSTNKLLSDNYVHIIDFLSDETEIQSMI